MSEQTLSQRLAYWRQCVGKDVLLQRCAHGTSAVVRVVEVLELKNGIALADATGWEYLVEAFGTKLTAYLLTPLPAAPEPASEAEAAYVEAETAGVGGRDPAPPRPSEADMAVDLDDLLVGRFPHHRKVIAACRRARYAEHEAGRLQSELEIMREAAEANRDAYAKAHRERVALRRAIAPDANIIEAVTDGFYEAQARLLWERLKEISSVCNGVLSLATKLDEIHRLATEGIE